MTLGNTSTTALNNYTGNTIISEGTLSMNAANQIPSGSSAGNLIIASMQGTGTFDLRGFAQTINGLSSGTAAVGTGIVTNSSGGSSALLTLGNNNATAIYNGSITQRVSRWQSRKLARARRPSGEWVPTPEPPPSTPGS